VAAKPPEHTEIEMMDCTGTITDIGILLGHGLNKKVRGNKSHWWKCRALITLCANLMFGGVVGYWLYDTLALEEDAFFVPASSE
jgi:hypothetical protein